MKTIPSTGIPRISVGNVVGELTNAYSAVISRKLPVRTLPSVMLWGPPGIGKSRAVRQLAKEIEHSTGKKTVVTDVRLLLFNPIDLRGIPTANAEKTLAVWLKPHIFQMDESEDVINILFLDEITAAPQSVQAAAYQITLDRTVGEHKLPENCIVIAAGNRVTDKSVSFRMPKALANRLLHIEVEGTYASWKSWAIANGIHPKVIGFLSFRQSHLMRFDTSSEDLAFATPRSWEMVSNLLNCVSDDVDQMYPLISGLVGIGTAVEFRTWSKVYASLPEISDIFEGKTPPVPTSTDAIYALVSAMTAYAREHKNEFPKIINSIQYAEKLPPDYSVILMKDYLNIEKGYKEKLLRVPEFVRWLHSKGRLFSGIIGG